MYLIRPGVHLNEATADVDPFTVQVVLIILKCDSELLVVGQGSIERGGACIELLGDSVWAVGP